MEELVIKTENLSKTYGKWFWKKPEAALVDLNLSIPKGMVFGFLGPNGAGKTTTIRLLMDLIKPSSGKAFVFGSSVDDVEVKRRIGFLPDSPSFSSYLTAYEFLNICAKLLRIPGDKRRDRIYEVLETVKMKEHAKSKLGGFSRGMIQRIGIAQAILNEPELLILDEPLVGLDPMGRQELKEIVAQQKALGTNVFFCSHILSDVEKICDHIGIVHKGRMLCFGAINDLLGSTGRVVRIRKGFDEVSQTLMGKSKSATKNKDGEWEMIFDAEESAAEIAEIEKNSPQAVSVSYAKESLEEFFFKTIDKSKREIGLAEA